MLPRISGTSQDGLMSWGHESDIRGVFATIRPGIERVIASNGEPYIPEDVYGALITGAADLYMFYRDDEFAGFGIFRCSQFDFEPKPVMNIWIGYSVDKGCGHYGVEVARAVKEAAGLDKAVFASPQMGWTGKFKLITAWYEV